MHPLETRLLEGDPLKCLLAEIAEEDATTVVVGSHGLSRATGIALGAVSTYLLHEAPCSVLIARGQIEREQWPRRIVVGVDGSDDSARAVAAARELGSRYGAGGPRDRRDQGLHVDVDAARRIEPACEQREDRALDVLNVLSETADLLVVGSRGLRGLRTLGSLSERLAHEARCSVLVLRKGASAS